MDEVMRARVDKIMNFYHEVGRMPSYGEICELMGFRSRNAAYKLVDKLVELGVVKRDAKGRIVPETVQTGVRLLGVVEAGFPSPAEEELLDTVSLDRWLVSNPSSTFMLKVSGDSMIEAGIMPGDMVLIDKALNPKNGDIVVAEVDGQWTMKYYYKKSDKIVLMPANPKYSPITPKNELRVAGVVISVIRKLR